MAKQAPEFQVYVVSVDFKSRRRSPYYALNKQLRTLGGIVSPTHQIKLLLSTHTAVKIRNDIRRAVLRAPDRVYVGKIAKGSAWFNLLRISNPKLKGLLKTFAQGAEADPQYIGAARRAMKGMLP